jgi:hypothetical protein
MSETRISSRAKKPLVDGSSIPILDAATLSALYPEPRQRHAMLLGVLQYTRRDRAETMTLVKRGDYAQACSLLHRIKGTVCLLTCDTKGYALFDRVDHKLRCANAHEKEAAVIEISIYLDGLERSLECAVRGSVAGGGDDGTVCERA